MPPLRLGAGGPSASPHWDVSRSVVSRPIDGDVVLAPQQHQRPTSVAELERRLAERQQANEWLTVLLPGVFRWLPPADRKVATQVCSSWRDAVRAGCPTCLP